MLQPEKSLLKKKKKSEIKLKIGDFFVKQALIYKQKTTDQPNSSTS